MYGTCTHVSLVCNVNLVDVLRWMSAVVHCAFGCTIQFTSSSIADNPNETQSTWYTFNMEIIQNHQSCSHVPPVPLGCYLIYAVSRIPISLDWVYLQLIIFWRSLPVNNTNSWSLRLYTVSVWLEVITHPSASFRVKLDVNNDVVWFFKCCGLHIMRLHTYQCRGQKKPDMCRPLAGTLVV